MSKPKLELLRSQLMGALIQNFEAKVFLADSTLARIINETDIEGCLREAEVGPATVREEVHETVLNGGKKMFAILTMMETQPAGLLLNFLKIDEMNSGNLDSRLPYAHVDRLIEILGSLSLATDFFKRQWTVISPLFREDRSDRKFNKNTILPFVKREKIGSGAHGDVYEVTFHETHHAFTFVTKNQPPKLACKEIAASDTFTNEKQILLLLRQIRHANMIQLLASYLTETEESGSIRCLIFPLADTSLQTLLDRDVSNLVPMYFQSYEEYLRQLHGLASALENLHNYVDAAEGVRMKGSHFDLAPRNILVKKGVLLLADFGLSRMRSQSSDSKTPFKGGVGDFLAPECTVEDFAPDSEHGRKSDVWSFGGILTVLIVFMKQGKGGVDKYRTSRRYVGANHGTTFRFHADGGVNHKMHRWLTELEKTLSPIERATLALALWMLSPEPEKRPAMDEVSTYLYLLAHRALFRVIDEQFERLLATRPALQLRIEQRRFTIWNGMASLAAQRVDPVTELREKEGHGSWLVESRTQFQAVSNLLQAIREENEFLLAGLKQDSPIAPIYGRLRELNSMLWNIAPLKERTDMLTMLESSLDQLHDKHGIQTVDLSRATTVPSWERQALLLAAMRFMTKNSQASTRAFQSSLAISPPCVKIVGTEGQANIVSMEEEGKTTPSLYLCEWITYQLHIMDQVPDCLFARVESIARNFAVRTKPADFNVLHCRGYFHDLSGGRFGLLFGLPGDVLPVTLRRVIKERTRPSLQCLFSLAQALVKSVNYFHRADWVHKNVSSRNVVFFDTLLGDPANRHEATDTLPTPYLIGFNHSRPMNQVTFTTGGADLDKVYLHPKYRTLPEPRFRLGYEYFAVGLLLFEIGMWEPITRSRLLGKRKIEDFEPDELLSLWRDHGVPLLGPLMGKKFRETVALCLSHELVKMADERAGKEFGERVVAELTKCCA